MSGATDFPNIIEMCLTIRPAIGTALMNAISATILIEVDEVGLSSEISKSNARPLMMDKNNLFSSVVLGLPFCRR